MRFVFRASGCSRFLGALFLAGWLAVWSAFVGLPIRMAIALTPDGWESELARALSHPAGWIVGAFTLFFTVAWVIGGVVGAWQLLQLLFGRDELTVTSEALSLRHGLGPIGITRSIDRSRIREVYVRRDGQALMIEADGARREASRLGTPTERQKAAEQVAIKPGPTTLPLRWVATPEANGALCIGLRRIDGTGCLGFVGVVALVSILFAIRFVAMLPPWGEATASALALALTALTLWGAFSRREWLVAPGRIESRVRWLSRARVQPFDRHSLRIDRRRDSDGDETVVLRGTIRGKKKTIYRDVNEDRDVIGLARFLEATSGWSIPPG